MDTREAELVLEVQAAQLRRRDAYERGGLTFFQQYKVDKAAGDAMEDLRRYMESKG
jgi:hypothetical protein